MGAVKTTRVTKAEWFEVALVLLREEGSKAVQVERLARQLGTSKSGFYWHFRDRHELMTQLLDHWAHEYTEVVSSNRLLPKLDPETRLLAAMEMILDNDLTEYDLSIRAWAAHDPDVARRVARVIRHRLEFIRGILAEIGFEGEELEMRTRLFVCYQSWERTMFPRDTKKKLRSLIPIRHALFISR